jgi:uncharacterized protein (TIGR03435 family)
MRAVSGFLLLMSCCAFGQAEAPIEEASQAPVARPEFEVVDVKPNTSGQPPGAGSVLPSGQFRAINIPLKEVIKFAYSVRDEAIAGAPAWIDSERYDINGKAAPVGLEETFWRTTSVVQVMKFSYNWDDTFRLMVQSFLADRFKLALHQEKRPMDVLALVAAGSGSKLQKAADSGRPECTRTVGAELRAEAVCKNVSMADLARAMQIFAPGYANREVVDLTGIEGTYDPQLDWVGIQNIDSGGLTMPGALEKQLGLKLEPRKLPVTVLVIDHVERPSEN